VVDCSIFKKREPGAILPVATVLKWLVSTNQQKNVFEREIHERNKWNANSCISRFRHKKSPVAGRTGDILKSFPAFSR